LILLGERSRSVSVAPDRDFNSDFKMKGHWLRKPKGSVAVVFVHGILSSGETCWRCESGAYWPDLLKAEAELDPIGIYVYTYQTDIFSGSYRLNDIVDDLKERAKLDGVLESKHIIFVCPSMGGIVVRKFLVQRGIDLINRKTEVGLFLVASPSLGSSYASLLLELAKVFGNSQAQALRFADDNTWLNDLDTEFQNLKEAGQLKIKGKELVEDKFIVLRKFFRRPVVERISGAKYFGEPYKVPKSDHFSIAKPSDKEAIQHRLLCQFIKEMTKGLSEFAPRIPEKTEDERLMALTSSYRLLAAAFAEAGGIGISEATASAILVSKIPKSDVHDFWRLIAKRVDGWKLFGVAAYVLTFVDNDGKGQDVIEYCLEEGRLSPQQRESLGTYMTAVNSREAVVWCHHQMTTHIKSDIYYNSFLHKHITIVATDCYDEMVAYLLYPNRGPTNYNVDSFYDAIRNLANPKPFVTRWIDWIRSGQFDGNRGDADESPIVLYKIFNEITAEPDPKFNLIIEETLTRVYHLLKSHEEVHKGLYHLVAMLDAKYTGADYVLSNIFPRVYMDRFSADEVALFSLLKSSFQLLAKLSKDPENKTLQTGVRDKWLEVSEIDKITGFWG